MNQSLSIKYSSRFRMLFLLLTMGFLLVFLLSMQSLLFLILFINMAYIYLAYLNFPALSIGEGQIHQHSFYSTTLQIESLKEVIDDKKTITFITSDEKMVVNKFLLDRESQHKLEEFINLKSLKK